MRPHNSKLVACGGEVVVVDERNVAAAGDVADVLGVAAMDDVVVVVGATAVVVVWV